ncbi:MAG: hypothetical protein ABSG36_14875 [Acidimicrobiales bacterium]|jgi:hypothetical protein
MPTIEANVATLRKSLNKLLSVKDGTLTSSTKTKLQAALRSLDDGDKGLATSKAALREATKAIDAYVADNADKPKGINSGGAVGSSTPGAGGGLIPSKSLFADDGAGVRSKAVPASVRAAQRTLELLKLRGSS